MKKRLFKILIGFTLGCIALVVGAYAYLHTAQFGALPEGDRLQKIEESPHYQDGQFRNIEVIPTMAIEKRSAIERLLRFIFRKKDPATRPPAAIPMMKTDLMALKKEENVLIWLGHTSFYMQLSGLRILIDPVFSENAAPIPFANRVFQGTNIYTPEEFPPIDILLMTHDHWDHLDYLAVTALKEKIAKIVCPLGVGAHFEHWGFSADRLVEMDWWNTFSMNANLTLHALPARHYSGRGLTRNKVLWGAYALITPKHKIYVSGDTGYGSHFKAASEKLGAFDLAILDSGQYNDDWRFVHMNPEDALQAATDLQTRVLLPAHIGKFSIAFHTWDDPFVRLTAGAKEEPFALWTPKIGETVYLDKKEQRFGAWWEEVLVPKQ